MKSNNPKVSVVLSVYNGARFITQAIESVLSQTFTDFEFIIIDDASTDATPMILSTFKDKRICILRNEKNLKLVESLNRGLKNSCGEYIARIDADDFSLPERFMKQVGFLDAHPDVGVLGTRVRQIDVNGKTLSTLDFPLTHNMIYWEMFFGLAIAHPSVMMRRDVIMSAGAYNPEFVHIEDTELWSRLITFTHFANLDEVLHVKRVHQESIGSTQYSIQQELEITIRRQLFKQILNRDVPKELVVAATQMPFFYFKNKKNIILLLLDLFCQFTKRNNLSLDELGIICEDFSKKILFINKTHYNILLKKLMKRFLPSPLRHRINIFIEKHF